MDNIVKPLKKGNQVKKLAILLLFLTIPSIVVADTPSLPDISTWTVKSRASIEFRIADNLPAYIGFTVEYQNPNDPNDFVRVIKRSIPFISATGVSIDATSSQRVVVLNFLKRSEERLASQLYNESDVIAYTHWHVIRDPRTKEQVQSGPAENGLLDQNGNWVFSSGEKMSTEQLSEPDLRDTSKIVLVGLKLSVKEGYHMLRINQGDLAVLSKKGEVKYATK